MDSTLIKLEETQRLRKKDNSDNLIIFNNNNNKLQQ